MDRLEEILAHKFTRFLMQRADHFVIMRRKAIAVCFKSMVLENRICLFLPFCLQNFLEACMLPCLMRHVDPHFKRGQHAYLRWRLYIGAVRNFVWTLYIFLTAVWANHACTLFKFTFKQVPAESHDTPLSLQRCCGGAKVMRPRTYSWETGCVISLFTPLISQQQQSVSILTIPIHTYTFTHLKQEILSF